MIGFEERAYNGSESEGEIQVVVAVLQGELSAPVSVRLFTTDATALSSQDYDPINQTLTFSPGNTRMTISLPVRDDDIDEEDEDLLASLELSIEDNDQMVQITPDQATLTIIDDDGIVFLNITFLSVFETFFFQVCR